MSFNAGWATANDRSGQYEPFACELNRAIALLRFEGFSIYRILHVNKQWISIESRLDFQEQLRIDPIIDETDPK